MSAIEIINKKILELNSFRNKREELSHDLYLINIDLETLNKLDESMLKFDVGMLKEILEKYDVNFEDISDLIKNVKNLVEFYVVIKKQVLKLPSVYELEINNLKEKLKEIKEDINNQLNSYSNIDEKISKLDDVVSLLRKEGSNKLTEEMLSNLYELLLKDSTLEEVLPIYQDLYNLDNDDKTDEYLNLSSSLSM